MGFALKLRHAPKAEIDARVSRAAEILNLVPYLDRYPRQLSGGQRQRVAMGRAIVRDPKVFLFDEPLSNLDAKLRVQMRAEIKELHQRLKTTTVYVTHDQVEAMTMADRIVVLNDGLIEQAGSPLELYDRPANIFVAGFIGSPAMNLLKGTIRLNGSPCFVTERASSPAFGSGAGRRQRPARGLWHQAGTSESRRWAGEGRGVGDRADRIGDADVRQARGREDRRGVARPRPRQTGGNSGHDSRSGCRASVRCCDRSPLN